MGFEIERKFLVQGDAWRDLITGSRHIRQAYLSTRTEASVRVRIIDEQRARLTIKGASRTEGKALSRAEFEYPVPIEDALAMLDLRVGQIIEKTRYHVPAGNGRMWEVDEFSGDLAGLVLAEIELADAEEVIAQPDWLGREVTSDPAYGNMTLALGL